MKVRNLLYIFLVTTILYACGSSHSTIGEFVKNSDSASIAFYLGPDSSSKIIIRDRESIQKLGDCIHGEIISPAKCVDSGSIWFYENGKKKLQVDFGLNADCSYFTYMMNDKIYTKKMDKEASKYLESIQSIATNTL